jgi:magnesium transporter
VGTVTTLGGLRQAYASADTRVWIDVEDADRGLLAELSSMLHIHPLVVDDIIERNQRAKIEEAGNDLHIVMFGLHHDQDRIVKHEIDIVLGRRFLLTAHDAGLKPRDAPFLRRDPDGHLDEGVDFTLWALCDWLVDDYFPVFDILGDEIDDMEDMVMQIASPVIVERLFALRKDLLVIRRSVNPVREIFNQLTNRDLPLISPDRVVYFRDIYDHLIRLTDEMDSYRELLSTTHDIYLSQVNNNLSEIMKRLTAVTAVLAGAGALAGIFGMSEAGLAISFEDMRFWIVTALIVAAGVLGFAYFRRIGWI